MRSLGCLLALFLWTAPAAAETAIRMYDVHLSVNGGSGAGTASLVIAEPPASMAFPLAFRAKNVRLVDAPARTTLQAEPFNTQTRVRVNFPGAAAEVRLRIAFDVEKAFTEPETVAGQKRALPSGNEILRHALVNTEGATIESYRFVAALPRDLRIQSIKEALPKSGRKEAEPRAQLVAIGDGPGVRLQVRNLRQGDAASLQVIVTPGARSPWWAVAGIALSVLYLIRFRDLVAPSRRDGEAVRKSGE